MVFIQSDSDVLTAEEPALVLVMLGTALGASVVVTVVVRGLHGSFSGNTIGVQFSIPLQLVDKV